VNDLTSSLEKTNLNHSDEKTQSLNELEEPVIGQKVSSKTSIMPNTNLGMPTPPISPHIQRVSLKTSNASIDLVFNQELPSSVFDSTDELVLILQKPRTLTFGENQIKLPLVKTEKFASMLDELNQELFAIESQCKVASWPQDPKKFYPQGIASSSPVGWVIVPTQSTQSILDHPSLTYLKDNEFIQYRYNIYFEEAVSGN
jgi:hypothetical protein